MSSLNATGNYTAIETVTRQNLIFLHKEHQRRTNDKKNGVNQGHGFGYSEALKWGWTKNEDKNEDKMK